jgi:ABC-2 type transport system permease protein
MTHAASTSPEFDFTAPAPRAGGILLATATLWRREMVRFFRQGTRVVSAAVTPLLFWLFLGFGFNNSFSMSAPTGHDAVTAAATHAVGYLQYFFPGIVMLMLLNTAVFSTISVIEDRREGFLQGVLVAPVPRLALVLGKVLGGASIATIQGLLFLAIWPLVGPGVTLAWLGVSLVVMFVAAMALTALGLCVAWPMDSTAGFHAVMMIFLMPMWLLSGAVFPLTAKTPVWLAAIMWCNPMTYGQAAFAESLTNGHNAMNSPVDFPLAAGLTAALTVLAILLAGALVSRRRKDGSA